MICTFIYQRWVILLIEQVSMEPQAALTENEADLMCLFRKNRFK